MPIARLAAALLLGVVVAMPAAAEPSSCDIPRQNLYVRDALEELYLWYDQLPPVDPTTFASPAAYLDAVRHRPLDTTFSYVTSRAASEAFYGESQYVGVGFTTAVSGAELRVLQVFPASPAAEAGIERGARLLTIGGTAVATLIVAGTLDAALGTAVAGQELVVEFRNRDGRTSTASLRKRPVTIPTVSLTRVFEVDGRRVGYLFFRNFVEPSAAALDEAFAALRGAGVTELVLDLRYNGGGLVRVAAHLGSLIGGRRTEGQVFAEYRHNDRNRRRDETLRFGAAPESLVLDRVVVIATRATASASELVINGLRPFVPVTVVGDRTYGKPVGQYQLPFCDVVLAPVSFASVNADGEGGYFDGLPADCLAADDVEHDLGDRDEASLREALHVIATGACTPATPAPDRSRVTTRTAPRQRDWASVVNAQ